jgi:hypothetical protein
MMDQKWFEMTALRKRHLSTSVWIPLRAIIKDKTEEEYGTLGFREDFYGVGSLLVPIDAKESAQGLGWSSIGLNDHGPYIEGEKYLPSDVYEHPSGEWFGSYLVLAHDVNSTEIPEWYLHPDFILALGLIKENDTWLRPSEDYTEVASLTRNNNGSPTLLNVKAEYLLDYLCARKMALYLTSYRSRTEVVEDASHIAWENNAKKEINGSDLWEGYVNPIHEGGMPFGQKMSIIHTGRTDVDPDEDVPAFEFPTDGNIVSTTSERSFKGKKLFQIRSELWRDEFIDPGNNSPRVRGDKIPATVYFTTDEKGKKESQDTLIEGSRWLWFKPTVMMTLAHRRGGSLFWSTRDTGGVTCSPGYDVHFGINKLGLINVYAKDIGLLPEWQQRIWAGYNISPEGGVSEELLASQMRADPADTQAPEKFLPQAWASLNEIFIRKLGEPLFQHHEEHYQIMEHTHRFRSTDRAGLFALAKDLARLTADSIDVRVLHKIVTPPKNEKWGSLKSLEKVLATMIEPAAAHNVMTPFFGVYEMRQGDAHLPSSELLKTLNMLEIDRDTNPVFQGFQLLHRFVTCLYEIGGIIDLTTIHASNVIVHADHIMNERSGKQRLLRVFLCHSSGDKPAVRQLYRQLKEENWIDPWLDEENLLPGQDWDFEIKNAVRKADIVIVCLSSGSVTKEGYVQKEINQALDIANEKPEETIFVIPLKLESCDVPNRLSKWQWVNYYEEGAYSRLLLALQRRSNSLEQ